MFHLVQKPLTTSSFLLVDVVFFFKLFATLFSHLCLTLSVSHSHSVPHVIGEWTHVVPILHAGSALYSSFLLLFDAFLKMLTCFSQLLLKPFHWGEGQKRNAGFISTYLSTRKSDSREFIMAATNPASLSVKSLSPCDLWGAVESCLWLWTHSGCRLKWSWI